MLFDKLSSLLSTTFCNWILDFLTSRPLTDWIGGHTSTDTTKYCVPRVPSNFNRGLIESILTCQMTTWHRTSEKTFNPPLPRNIIIIVTLARWCTCAMCRSHRTAKESDNPCCSSGRRYRMICWLQGSLFPLGYKTATSPPTKAQVPLISLTSAPHAPHLALTVVILN